MRIRPTGQIFDVAPASARRMLAEGTAEPFEDHLAQLQMPPAGAEVAEVQIYEMRRARIQKSATGTAPQI